MPNWRRGSLEAGWRREAGESGKARAWRRPPVGNLRTDASRARRVLPPSAAKSAGSDVGAPEVAACSVSYRAGS